MGNVVRAENIASEMEPRNADALGDREIIDRVLSGDHSAYELLLRRYNQCLYRAIRCLTRDGVEAEDLVQETWVRAYEHLNQFAGRAAFSTWLIRIALHEGFLRIKRNRRRVSIQERNLGPKLVRSLGSSNHPEQRAMRNEVRRILDQAVEALPEAYRTVFVLREVEELSTADTAQCLGLTEEAVKTRLRRSRLFLRRELASYGATELANLYQFLGDRCDTMVRKVMARLSLAAPTADISTGSPPAR